MLQRELQWRPTLVILSYSRNFQLERLASTTVQAGSDISNAWLSSYSQPFNYGSSRRVPKQIFSTSAYSLVALYSISCATQTPFVLNQPFVRNQPCPPHRRVMPDSG